MLISLTAGIAFLLLGIWMIRKSKLLKAEFGATGDTGYRSAARFVVFFGGMFVFLGISNLLQLAGTLP